MRNQKVFISIATHIIEMIIVSFRKHIKYNGYSEGAGQPLSGSFVEPCRTFRHREHRDKLGIFDTTFGNECNKFINAIKPQQAVTDILLNVAPT